jgi:hypothetical protein
MRQWQFVKRALWVSVAALVGASALLSTRAQVASPPSLTIRATTPQSAVLTWPSAGGNFVVERTASLLPPIAWQTLAQTPVLSGDQRTVTVTVQSGVQYYRLRETSGAMLTIAESSPAPGDRGVAVTRETIFRLTGTLAADTVLTTNHLYAVAGGRRVLSRIELSGDRRTVTLFYLERLSADARIEVTFDGLGVFDTANRPVDLDGDGVAGGAATLQFQTLSTTALSTTGIEGRVFASEKNLDGSNRPLANVTISVDGMEETLRTTTDATGFFRLMPCPAGRFFVSVDGRTAEGSQWPGGAYYPFVGKAWEAAPGRTNNLAGGDGVVYLPRIQADALRTVSTSGETRITFAPSVLATNPALAGVEITVPPNALFSDNGTRGGQVGIAPVASDRLPEPLPAGLNLPLVITIQTDGPSNFDVPVPVKFPNLPDPVTGLKLGPGEKTVLWSFNHDTGRWEPQGTMTISADGLFAVSDPGVGVRQPGWHGNAPGSGGGGPGGGGPRGGGPKGGDCKDENANGFCDEDDAKRCETDKLKTIFAGVDAGIGFVPQPDMGPLSACLVGGSQSLAQGVRDCAIDPMGCEQTVAVKTADFAIDCGLSFVPGSKSFREAVTWIKRVKGLFDVGLAYANWELCKDTAPSRLAGGPRRHAVVVGGFPTAGNPFLQQYEVETRLHQLIGLIYGNAVWAEIDPTEWPLSAAIVRAIKAAVEANSAEATVISSAERAAILALPRPDLITPNHVEALLERIEKLTANETPAEGELDLAGIEQESNALSAILTEVSAEGWNRIYDGWTRGVALARSLSQTGNAAASMATLASTVQLQAGAPTQAAMPARPLNYLLADLQSGFEQRGRLNAQGRFDGVILRPEASYVVVYFDASTLRSGAAFFTSRQAGQLTTIPGAPLARPPAIPDADGDGLSDLGERVLGTLADDTDSDDDGVPDGAEISNGTNPSDGQPLGLGVMASRDTPGSAVEIDTANDFAVVADSGSGLAVFDVSNPLDPVLLSQLDPANATFTAVAMTGPYVAGVPGASPHGVTIFGLSTDGVLLPVGSTPLGEVPKTVAAAGRYAYAPGRSSNQRTLAVVQLSNSRLVRHVPVPGGSEVTALAIDGDALWALSGTRLLSFRIVGDNLQPLGELNLGILSTSPLEPGPELTAGNGRVYVGDFNGFQVVDGSNPVTPVLLYDPLTTQAAIHDFALNGSGLLLPVTSFAGTVTLSLSAYDIRNDRSTNFLTSFNTPGETRAVVLHRGYALTADGTAGMAPVNFLTPDRGTNAPTVRLTPFTSHAAAGQEADELFFVSTTTSDDVQVRDVEFYIDGSLAGLSGKFPFASTLRAPAKTATKTSFLLRAKATDTGGNVGWSDALSITLLPDLTPPGLLSLTPSPNSTRPRGSVSRLSAVFDSEIDITSIQNAWTLQSAGPDGNFGTADDVSVTGGRMTFDQPDRTAIFQFSAPLLSGRYRSRLASSVKDLQGNPMSADVTWDFTIPTTLVVASTPAHQSVWLSDSLRRVEVRFDERLSAASVTADALSVFTTNQVNPLRIPGGVAFASPDARAAVLEFAQPIPNGGYRIAITPEIRDVYGSPVATNFPMTFLVKGPALWTNDLSGVWTGRTNWSAGTLPILNDHVVIDRPNANPTISLRSAVTLTSFRSEEALTFDNFNGSLTVLDRAVFNGPLNMVVSGGDLEGQFFEFNGSASLAGRLQIGAEAVFTGPASVTAGSLSLDRGRSRFLNRLDLRHHLILGAHVLTLEPGAIATLGDSQVGFGGTSSRFIIAAGARLELTPTNTQFNAVSFVGNQVETGALVVNEGDFIKRGAATSFFTRLELLNTGRLQVDEGTLNAGSGFTNTGTILVSPAGRLDVGSRFRHAFSGRITNEGYIRMPDNAVLDGTYDGTGMTEVSGAQNSAQFNAPIRSTASWLITGSATFNGDTVELLGPVTLRGGRLFLNSPAESRVPDLRLEVDPRFGGGNVIGGRGLLVFREPRTWTHPIQFIDTLRLRLEVPTTIPTNFTVSAAAQVDLLADTLWTGGTVSGNVQIAPGVVLDLAPTTNATLRLPFPQAGILRKTGSGIVSLQRFRESSQGGGDSVTNRSLIDVQSGLLAIPSGAPFFVQEAGRLHLASGTRFVTDAMRLIGGELTGFGTISIISDSINRGCRLEAIVAPGSPENPYGILTFAFQGSPNWLPGSRTLFDIGGTVPGVSHDQIVAERTLDIDGGTLEIRTSPGFTPAVGQEFTVMTGSSRTGTFTETTGLELGNGRRYRVVYESRVVKLRVE